MATRQTTNYKLNLWEPTDRFLREEFNEDNQKIDAALAQKAEASALTALAQTVTGKADAATQVHIAAGAYHGSGALDTNATIDFGVPAKLVVITPKSYPDQVAVLVRPQGTAPGSNHTENVPELYVTWGETSITFQTCSNGILHTMNDPKLVYHWFAIY